MAKRKHAHLLANGGGRPFLAVLVLAALCGLLIGWVLQGGLQKPIPFWPKAPIHHVAQAPAAKPRPHHGTPLETPLVAAPVVAPAKPVKAVSPTPNQPTETLQADTTEALPAEAEPAPAQTQTKVAAPAHWLWKEHAQAVDVPKGAPVLAILIDDMGDHEPDDKTTMKETSYRAVRALPRPVTLAFFPWYDDGITLAHTAHKMGHEIMVHMPMEPLPHGDAVFDPGENALKTGMDKAEIAKLINHNFAPFADIATGFNNHMGSKFTRWPAGMRAVLETAQSKGLLFVDSRTAGHTAVAGARKGLALPVLTRDVFLDDAPDAVRKQLAQAVALAKKQGHALAIGHPLPNTLDVLEEELPKLKAQGVYLVPVSALVK